VFADGRRIGQPEFDDFNQRFIDGAGTKLSTLTLGEQFGYEFDFGDSWTHLCTVAPTRIDSAPELGILPSGSLPYRGATNSRSCASRVCKVLRHSSHLPDAPFHAYSRPPPVMMAPNSSSELPSVRRSPDLA
jgi:hypothetical protein